MNYERIRDLSLIHTNPKLLIACDSTGGIGEKEGDVLQVPPEVTGEFLARVPLMELISMGAKPTGFFATFSVEMDPTGKRLLKGIHKAFDSIGIEASSINGSTEENMQSYSTGAGITVIAELPSDYHIPSAHAGESVYLWGLPLVGDEVLKSNQVIASQHAWELRDQAGVGEMIMVGSKGIDYELRVLLERNHLQIKSYAHKALFDKSGGPATCLIVSGDASLEDVFNKYHYHYECLGVLDTKK